MSRSLNDRSPISRASVLRGGLGLVGAALVAACGAPVTSGGVPTSAPAPTAAAKEAPAAQPTPTAAPAATKPAGAATKPAGAATAPATSAAATAAPAASGDQGDVEKLYAEAKKEGKVVWWTAHYAQSAAEVVRDAFVAKYPGIEVEFIRQTAQVIYQRLTQNLKAGVKELDVFASTDESHYVTLKKQSVFASFTPAGLDQLPKEYQVIDPERTYHVGALGFDVINYHTQKGAPLQKWTDLLDEKWREQVTVGHPGFSGYVGNWVVAMWDKYGWDYFTKFEKNKPKINRSVNDTVTDILAGERAVGSGPDNYSLEKKAAGNPIDIQFPSDDAILIVAPIAVMKDAPHPSAGRLFMSFVYTREYSQALAKTFNYPLRADVPPPSGKPLAEVKLYRNKPERLEQGIPDAIAKWRETFGV
ncbi:MAG TPA: extracellular solute-binding protein [Chloroflexota bacterium]